MKWLKEENGQLIPPPIFDKETGMVNCHLNENWLTNNGYTQWSDADIEEWYKNNTEEKDMTSFNNACSFFRQVCLEIRTLIGDSDFKGGYDDMIKFYNSAAFKNDNDEVRQRALKLAAAWNGCNELCVYEGEKVGYGVPQWWYYCWENFDGGEQIQKIITVESPVSFELQDGYVFQRYIDSYASISDNSTLTFTLAQGSELPNGLELNNTLIAGIFSGSSVNSSTTIIVSAPGAESKEIVINWIVAQPITFTIENNNIEMDMCVGETKTINVPEVSGAYTNRGTITYSLEEQNDFASITSDGVLTISPTSFGDYSFNVLLKHDNLSTTVHIFRVTLSVIDEEIIEEYHNKSTIAEGSSKDASSQITDIKDDLKDISDGLDDIITSNPKGVYSIQICGIEEAKGEYFTIGEEVYQNENGYVLSYGVHPPVHLINEAWVLAKDDVVYYYTFSKDLVGADWNANGTATHPAPTVLPVVIKN